jgi:hypothetical protein
VDAAPGRAGRPRSAAASGCIEIGGACPASDINIFVGIQTDVPGFFLLIYSQKGGVIQICAGGIEFNDEDIAGTAVGGVEGSGGGSEVG